MANSDPQAKNPEFIAVDVDIRSRSDLTPLVSALAPNVLVRSVGKFRGRHWIHLMLHGSPPTPSAAIRRYAKIFDRLPQRAQRLFKSAAKEFDIGFEGGLDPRPGDSVLVSEWVLSARDTEIVERLGASVRITIYADKNER